MTLLLLEIHFITVQFNLVFFPSIFSFFFFSFPLRCSMCVKTLFIWGHCCFPLAVAETFFRRPVTDCFVQL